MKHKHAKCIVHSIDTLYKENKSEDNKNRYKVHVTCVFRITSHLFQSAATVPVLPINCYSFRKLSQHIIHTCDADRAQAEPNFALSKGT